MHFYKSLGTWSPVEKPGHILPTSRRQNVNDDQLHHQEDVVLVPEAEMIDGEIGMAKSTYPDPVVILIEL